MTASELRQLPSEPAQLSAPLRALWFASQGQWEKAHHLVQDDGSAEAAWVHAYLHWEEGDMGNSRYWYNRAGKSQHGADLKGEWEHIASALLKE